MNTHTISRTARALGGIAWAFDTVVRVTGKYAQKGIDKLNNRPTYYVVIEMPDKEGVFNVIREYDRVKKMKINHVLDALELLPEAIVSIKRNQ